MKIKKGTKLIAIDPCEMEDEGEKALIVGKEYTVLKIEAEKFEGEAIVIKSEIDNNHYFLIAELKDFFTFAENAPENRL